MMDAAQFRQGVADPAHGTTCVEAKRLRYSTDPMSKVLDDDDLLIEIMVRLGFPTTLSPTAIVCKRWFHHASDPAFLHRFRRLNPPQLLGFYVGTCCGRPRSFMLECQHPPELACVFRSTSFDMKGSVMGCRNGAVFYVQYDHPPRSMFASHYPLFPKRGMVSILPLPRHRLEDGNVMVSQRLLKGGGFNASYCYVVIEATEEKTKSIVHVYLMQDGVWCMYASTVTELRCQRPMLIGNKIYIPAFPSDILVFDLATLSFSALQLPPGLLTDDKRKGNMMSRADDGSSVYFIKLDKLQLYIWLHKGDSCQLVDTFCLQDMCANFMVSDDTLTKKHSNTLRLVLVGDNAEFVILRMAKRILYLDVKSRTLQKVYEMAENESYLRYVHPFMMIWPPSFPALKDDLERDSG